MVVARLHLVEQRAVDLDAERLTRRASQTATVSSSPPRPTSTARGPRRRRGSRYSMMSRGTRPSMADDQVAHLETCLRSRRSGRDSNDSRGGHHTRIRAVAWVVCPADRCPARRAPRLLRGCRDGDQGTGVDGACLRAAGVLLPRDRAQPAGRRRLRRPRRGVRRRRRRGAAGQPHHAVRPRLRAGGRRGGPSQRAATSSTRCARS